MGHDVHLDPAGNPRFIERRFVVERGFGGYRLDHYLKRKIPRMSRTVLQRLIRAYLVPVRGRALKPHSPVAVGDELVLRHPALPEPPCPRTFGVLHDDGEVLVIDKPAGLPVHASARYYFNTLTRLLGERYPRQDVQICHRLDRETSGALVCARGRRAAARVKAAFADKRVTKHYVALVYGQPPWPDASGDDHVIDLPLGLVASPSARIKIRMEVRGDAQPAVTRVRVLERRAHAALVRCEPVTGRQHQIRAHLAAVGYPIVGDKLYAHGDDVFAACCDVGPALTPALRELLQLPRHALHAARVVAPHPGTGQPLAVGCPLPADIRELVVRPR